MSFHSFSLDPRTVLGVGPGASLDEIRDAYRAKSKKHHPDLGGDEWAFRMVVRAYEIVMTTAGAPSSQLWSTRIADVGQQGQAPDWSRIWSPRFSTSGSTSKAPNGFDETAHSAGGASSEPEEEERSETVSHGTRSPIAEPDELRTVDVELIWTRFEKEGSRQLLSTQEGDDATLSVCLVISWPPHELVDHAADFTSTGETLRSLIDLFESLRGQKPVIAGRSRIEDGQFVGWLSYVDVLTAQDAFLTLRDEFRDRGLTIKLYTRDERVPFDWYGAGHQPVMSDAS
jgi:DnaJ domain